MKQYLVVINSFAEHDLRIAADWYAERKEELDSEFLKEVDKTIQRIKENPQQFAIIRKKIRMATVKRFPFGIYYYVGMDVINVFAVFHFSRNPKVLRKRIK